MPHARSSQEKEKNNKDQKATVKAVASFFVFMEIDKNPPAFFQYSRIYILHMVLLFGAL